MPTLPAVNPQQLATQLSQRAQALSSDASTFPFLKMSKAGEWIYGADEIETQDGSEWAINPSSFVEGYVCWGEGEILGEEMTPMTGQPVIYNDLPNVGGKRGWEKQVGFMLACTNGEDKGTQVLYKTASKGGQKAARKLIDEVVAQINRDPSEFVAHVRLDSSSYKHPTYGKIYTPIFEIVAWSALNATEASTAPPEQAITASSTPEQEPEQQDMAAPEPAPEAVKKRKRRPIAQ